MPELIAVVDTGVMCCWLEVPGKSTAGSGAGAWNKARADKEINAVVKAKGTLILPLSVVVEVANHIAQSNVSRRTRAIDLFNKVLATLDDTRPWRKFEETKRLWVRDWYIKAAEEWPEYANSGIGLADYSLIGIAHYFFELGSEVKVLTTDALLGSQVGHLVPEQRVRRR